MTRQTVTIQEWLEMTEESQAATARRFGIPQERLRRIKRGVVPWMVDVEGGEPVKFYVPEDVLWEAS